MSADCQTENIKLTYFNIRGIAEPIRYLLKLANQEFEDVRLEMDETWPLKKPDYPWGQLPLLEVNGQKLSQSIAIGRFLAKRHGFAGKTEFEAAKCDEYLDALKDLNTEWAKWFRSPTDEEKSAQMIQLKELHVPKYFSQFDSIIKKNGQWLVGDSVTWADLFLAHSASSFSQMIGDPTLLEKYPNLNELIKSVFELDPIAEWIKVRPVTPF